MSFNTDTKNTKNLKKQLKLLKTEFSESSTDISCAEKCGKTQKNDICANYPDHKCAI